MATSGLTLALKDRSSYWHQRLNSIPTSGLFICYSLRGDIFRFAYSLNVRSSIFFVCLRLKLVCTECALSTQSLRHRSVWLARKPSSKLNKYVLIDNIRIYGEDLASKINCAPPTPIIFSCYRFLIWFFGMLLHPLFMRVHLLGKG